MRLPIGVVAVLLLGFLGVALLRDRRPSRWTEIVAPRVSGTAGKEAPAAIAPESTPGQRAVTAIEGLPIRALAVRPTRPLLTLLVTNEGDVLGASREPGSQSLEIYALRGWPHGQVTETRVTTSAEEAATLSAPVGGGGWVAYVRQGQRARPVLRRIDASQRLLLEDPSCDVASDPASPPIAMSAGRLVWADECETPGGGATQRILLFEVETRATSTLWNAPVGVRVDNISVDGDTVVFTTLREQAGDEGGEIAVIDIPSRAARTIHKGRDGSLPEVSGRLIVWKTSARFEFGGVYIHDLVSGEGAEILRADSAHAGGYDSPVGGYAGVTWRSARDDGVRVYLPRRRDFITVDSQGKGPSVRGRHLVWARHPSEGEQILLYGDLANLVK